MIRGRIGSNHRLYDWNLLLLYYARSTRGQEQRMVGSESV